MSGAPDPGGAADNGGDLAAYDFSLPEELVAQEPPPRRGDSRLLVLNRSTRTIEHRSFGEIDSFLGPGDVLVLNDTRVFPARLRLRRPTGGKVEALLLEPCAGGGAWTALARPLRLLKSAEPLAIDSPGGGAGVTVRSMGRDGERVILELTGEHGTLEPDEVIALLERVGETPLPPYIRRSPAERRSSADRDRYQTVYARRTGAVAAPTAGFHFTEDILARAVRKGARVETLTLHVGLGTFLPLTPESFARPTLHRERVEIGEETCREVLGARAGGRRVVAVGTTSARALESLAATPRIPYEGETDLFIKPGHAFLAVDALITNFHLPRSSLLLLVSAFAGRELVLDAYQEAVRERYRFYSYGDAMLIL
ncbi:MAG TPA: tRNA preQ1(34) S-adenosylmethionine ribosyltransferase-isomerase QueA [Planctomycetota bacterium]|nr:tRNA preQ1(34) S-adenosylmethionine ribosyltransferase-isomerase QueA [Planctomycetota bacterium]